MLAFTSSQWNFNQSYLSRSNVFKEAQQDSQKQFQKIFWKGSAAMLVASLLSQ